MGPGGESPSLDTVGVSGAGGAAQASRTGRWPGLVVVAALAGARAAGSGCDGLMVGGTRVVMVPASVGAGFVLGAGGHYTSLRDAAGAGGSRPGAAVLRRRPSPGGSPLGC